MVMKNEICTFDPSLSCYNTRFYYLIYSYTGCPKIRGTAYQYVVNKISGKNVFKKSIFFFVEDMDLFVTLNVATLATFKSILCIPIVYKYFIFVVSMEMRKTKAMLPYVI
jgi:hypothetical protein